MSLAQQRYSEALLSIAKDKNCVTEYKEELKTLKKAFFTTPEIYTFINNPRYTFENKCELIKNAFSSSYSKDIVNFLILLVKKNRFSEFEGIVNKYIEYSNRVSNVLRIELYTATELTQEQMDAIFEKYKRIYHATDIKSEVFIQPELIGGFIVRIEDTFHDYSLQNKLKKITTNMKNGSEKL